MTTTPPSARCAAAQLTTPYSFDEVMDHATRGQYAKGGGMVTYNGRKAIVWEGPFVNSGGGIYFTKLREQDLDLPYDYSVSQVRDHLQRVLFRYAVIEDIKGMAGNGHQKATKAGRIFMTKLAAAEWIVKTNQAAGERPDSLFNAQYIASQTYHAGAPAHGREDVRWTIEER